MLKAEAYNNLGNHLFYEMNRLPEAEAAYLCALQLKPDYAEAHINLGNLFQVTRRWSDAEVAYRRALDLRPGYAEGYNNLGIVFQETQRLQEAEVAFLRALELKPDFAEGHLNLGNLLKKMKRLPEAELAYLSALELKPDYAKGHYNLGNLLQEMQRLLEAEAAYLRALELKPDFAEAYNNLAGALRGQHKLAEAVSSCRMAISLKPDYAEAYSNLGEALQNQGKLEAAVEGYRKALSLKPDFAEARWKLAMAQIPQVVGTHEEIEECRASFLRELAELNAWFDADRAELGHKAVGTDQPFYLAYQEHNNRDVLFQYGTLCARLMKHWQDRQTFPSQSVMPSSAVRVGIVSAHIRSHPVWDAIIKGWFQHLDRDRVELHIFSVDSPQDDETNWARFRSASFEQGEKSLRQWVDAILEKQVDVLIYPEIGMDMLTVKLASLRLAPVQVAAWGHPETTGLPTMDYYLSAEYLEPPDAQNNYTEQLVRLPHLGCHYHPELVTSSVPDFASLGIDDGVPLLLCPGAPFKYAPQHDHIFVEIAHKLGRCQFVYFTHHGKHDLSEKLCQRLDRAFAKANMNFNDYCTFIPWQKKSEFYGLMMRADIFLDTIGFSGFNTAMQAIECGLPIVTREGRFMRGKLASGILRRMGLTELIANTKEEYVDLAVKLAQNAEYRRDIRQRIASSRPVLFDDVAPVRALEDFLVSAVKRN